MSLYTSSRNPNYFASPEKFWPQRWNRENGSYIAANPYASMPFAMGARSCIGKKIADTQMTVAIKEVIHMYGQNQQREVRVCAYPLDIIELSLSVLIN